MNKYNLVPNIRFKGFDDKWSEKKLDNVVAVIMGQSPSSSNYHEHQVNHSMILIQGNADIENNKIKPRLWTTQITKETIPNDIILTVRAPVGEVAKNDFNAVLGRGVAALRGNKFLYYYLENIKQIGYWNCISTGSTFMSISSDDIKEVRISLPRCKEQKCIYNFFTKLDKLLDLQQQKIDKLELLKKALLQKLFPKHDAQIPELRFKGFEDDWQEKKLSHVVDIIMGQSPSSTNYYDTPIENSMILIQGNADIKHHNVKPRIWTTQITKIAIPKDVLLTVRAPVGEVAKNKYEAVIGRGMAALRGNDFLYYNLEKLKEVGYWERLSTGSTFESISSNDIRDTKIKIPSCKEQKKVYNFLSKVDQLIELENQKLQNFQQVKKCLLQNMFVE